MTSKQLDKLVQGYQKMAQRLAERLHEAEEHTRVAWHEIIDNIRDETVSLQELTRTEAQQVADWLRRDIHAIVSEARETKEEFKTWFPFELKVEESYLWDKILSAADPTTVDLLALKEAAMLADFEIWRTGEVTAPGILECTKCGEQLHFNHTARIPPCPKCHNTTFVRISSAAPAENDND